MKGGREQSRGSGGRVSKVVRGLGWAGVKGGRL